MTDVTAPLVLRGETDRAWLVGRALLGASLVAALLLGSNLFQVSGWMVGDIAYHRGVAYTMQAGAWQGEGPYPGLLSYYGGLYPLVIGAVALLAGTTFDTALSVASWGFALLWPLALWRLGGRIWPADPVAAGIFVVLGTTAAPFTHRNLLWVDSVLASAQNVFPVYPRDIAMLLVVVLATAWLAPSARGRVVGAGLALAGIVLVHLQIGILAGWLLLVWTALRVRREGDRSAARELAACAGIAAVVSAWWWLPRLAAVVSARGVLLGGYPGAPELRLGPDNVLMAFGVVGVLAVLGFAVLAARGRLPGRLAPFLAWIAAFVPLIAIDRAVGGFDLLSERRVWLVTSIPITVLAASVGVRMLRLARAPRNLLLAAVIGAASIPGTIATVRLVDGAWSPGRAGGRDFDAATWEPMFRELNRRARAEGGYVVATYDAYATWVWSFSGAQVTSLWLPGPFKLGFDPAALTGHGQVERVEAQTRGFQGGMAGICGVARAYGADAILLDADSGLVGTHDVSPGAPYRVDPRQRSEATIMRGVGPGTTYRDLGGRDVLELAAGATWSAGWTDPAARQLVVEVALAPPPPAAGTGAGGGARAGAAIRVSGAGVSAEVGAGLVTGFHRLTVPLPEGTGRDLTIEALRGVELIRVTTFAPLPGVDVPDGPFVRATSELCPAP